MQPTDSPQDPPAPGNLLFTVAFDPPGEGGMRQLAKMLGSSVVRTGFSGDMAIFRNTEAPIFAAGRPGIEEVLLPTPPLEGSPLADHARSWKPHVTGFIEPDNYAWIVFLDADCLCLRNIDHLLSERQGDILYQPDRRRRITEAPFHAYLTEEEMTAAAPRQGISSGTWAVRGHCFAAVMEAFAGIMQRPPQRGSHWLEQGAWNRLILDAAAHGWRAEAFEPHEIQFPLSADPDWNLYRDAAIVHASGPSVMDRIPFLFGLYMQRFFWDRPGTLLNLLEM